MSKVTLIEDSTEDILTELHKRIADGRVDNNVVAVLISALNHSNERTLQIERDKTMDLEIALVAALGKKTATYGSENREQFITSKLKKWEGKLRFTFNGLK